MRRSLFLPLLAGGALLLNGCFLQVRQLRDDNNMLKAKVLQLQQDSAAVQNEVANVRAENIVLREKLMDAEQASSGAREAAAAEKDATEAARKRAEQALLETKTAMAVDIEARIARENDLKLQLDSLSSRNETLSNENLLLLEQEREAREAQAAAVAALEEKSATLDKLLDDHRSVTAERDDARAERDDYRRQLASLTTDKATATEELEKTSTALRDREKELAAARRELEETTATAKAATDAMAAGREHADALRTHLRTALSPDGEQIAIPDGEAVIVRLRTDALFQSGTVLLTKEGEAVLSRIAKALEGREFAQLVAEGHTDNVPVKNMPFVDNWDLAAARSAAVTRYLARETWVPAKKLRAQSSAFFDPVASNETPDGRKANRRVDLVIEP